MDAVTRQQAVRGAAACVAEGMRIRDSLAVEEAARRAHWAGGPSVERLAAEIRAQRAKRPQAAGDHGMHSPHDVHDQPSIMLAAVGAR